MGQPTPGPKPTHRSALPLALVTAVIAAVWAGWNAWAVQQGRTTPLDLDGWGWLVAQMQTNGRSLATLFSSPSLWKGPVVPFVFGLCYCIAPMAESVLVLNAAFFALSAAVLVCAFHALGANRWAATAAVLAWVLYFPHAIVFGYYYAEPFLGLLSALLLLLAAWTLKAKPRLGALACGAVAGLLLLARAPFLPVVVGLGVFLWLRMGKARWTAVGLYLLGLLVLYAPWPIRNWAMEREFIPFTTEGGKILFQGTYLAGDDPVMHDLRAIPEFNELEKGEEGLSAPVQYRFWKALADAEVRRNPRGEALLCVRKAIRFWMYLPAHSWLPNWKTGLAAVVFLPLGLAGFVLRRRDPLAQLCALWVVGLWAFHSLVHAELRYNFPVLPMMLMLAVLGVQACWKLLPAARRPKSAAPEQAKTTERTQECPQLSNPSHP